MYVCGATDEDLRAIVKHVFQLRVNLELPSHFISAEIKGEEKGVRGGRGRVWAVTAAERVN